MRYCPRCLNTDERYFYTGERGTYCRKCISFSRVFLEETLEPVSLSENTEGSEEYTLLFPLTPYQKEIAMQCSVEIEKSDVLLQCVCGAGKTEMCMETMASFLAQGKKVGFAIARRQVVLEVAGRLQSYFTKAKVIPVCGGHTSETQGDIVVCTTHQLYRYYHAFDLLILDEPDAFPFRGNEVLHGIALTSCRGHTLYLTATPDRYLSERVEKGDLCCLRLNQRPHGKPLPVPVCRTGVKPVLLVILYRWLQKHPYSIVFVPTIAQAGYFHALFSLFSENGYVCTSKTENKDAVIEAFRSQKKGVLFATTILERGVTFPDVDVCVFEANSPVYDRAGLVQMAGRAGRNFHNPYGDVLFLCTARSEMVLESIRDIEEANRNAMSAV